MKVLWAIDAFEKNRKMEKSISRWIGGLAKRVDLAYVSSPLVSEIVLAMDLPEKERRIDFPLKEIRKRFSAQKFPGLIVSWAKEPSLNKMAPSLASLAQKKGYDLLVLPTHSRSAIDTFFLGSFAEAILQHSKLPVLFLPPTGTSRKIRTLLLADDLEESSSKAREKIIRLSRKAKLKLRHFHVAGAGYHLDLKAQKHNRFRVWVDERLAQMQKKYKSTSYSASVGKGDFVSSILEASENADCIGLIAKTGALGAALGGSVTHRVIRKSPKPVLVVRG